MVEQTSSEPQRCPLLSETKCCNILSFVMVVVYELLGIFNNQYVLVIGHKKELHVPEGFQLRIANPLIQTSGYTLSGRMTTA